jgi:hypothetical protein
MVKELYARFGIAPPASRHFATLYLALGGILLGGGGTGSDGGAEAALIDMFCTTVKPPLCEAEYACCSSPRFGGNIGVDKCKTSVQLTWAMFCTADGDEKVAILALLRDVAPDQQKNRQDTKAAKEELQGPPRHLPLLFPCFLAPLAPFRFAPSPTSRSSARVPADGCHRVRPGVV